MNWPSRNAKVLSSISGWWEISSVAVIYWRCGAMIKLFTNNYSVKCTNGSKWTSQTLRVKCNFFKFKYSMKVYLSGSTKLSKENGSFSPIWHELNYFWKYRNFKTIFIHLSHVSWHPNIRQQSKNKYLSKLDVLQYHGLF